MVLNSFFLTYLNHNELHRLGSEILQTVGPAFSGDVWLERIAQHTQGLLDDLRQALDRKDNSDVTQQIREADEARDAAFVAFRAGVEFAARHIDPAAREAGQRLGEELETYGASLHRAGFGEQTTLTDALLGALAEADNAAAVTAAGLDAFVQQLTDTQTTFKELVHRRQDAEASANLPLLRTVRPGIHDDLTLIHGLLSFLADTDPASVDATIRTLNERVEEIITPARARRTRSENETAETSVAVAI